MKRLFKFFTLLFFCFHLGVAQESLKKHTVSSGETIFSIAKKYNVTPYDIKKANPGAIDGVKVDDVLEHEMHSEYYMVDKEAAEKINKAKKNGNKIICVGTTSCRTVESASNENGEIVESSGWTNIFIYPGYKFKMVDKLITNFHLPESTLIMLVSALVSKDAVLNAYNTAVLEKYRFFSFGDAMIIK